MLMRHAWSMGVRSWDQLVGTDGRLATTPDLAGVPLNLLTGRRLKDHVLGPMGQRVLLGPPACSVRCHCTAAQRLATAMKPLVCVQHRAIAQDA